MDGSIYRDPQTNIRWSSKNPAKVRGRLLGARGAKTLQENSLQNQLTRAHNQGACIDLTYVLCMYFMAVYLGVPVGPLTGGVESVSDSFACFWDPFPPTGLPYPALIWGDVSNFTITWYTMFGCYPWEACPFLKGDEEEWMMGRRDWKEGEKL